VTTHVPEIDERPAMKLSRPAATATLDEFDTITREEYRRRRQAELFDDPPGRRPPQTIRLRGDVL
jgi:hypothetical protein